MKIKYPRIFDLLNRIYAPAVNILRRFCWFVREKETKYNFATPKTFS